eukprot:TRINITY_DN9306_c0_g2_i1.p1 TRINITY_DN9306_c0_g2~~TRINITY_DN9306_c0_g2_i1.p1  ORF type:complete len:258 (+),score=17.52 TRINITY_DN9306_c0_g2_i1:220-993(+)
MFFCVKTWQAKLVRKKDTKQVYVMKIISKLVYGEVVNMNCTLCFPFLVGLHYFFQSKSDLYYVMDYVDGYHLRPYLQIAKRFPPKQVRFYCAEIAMTLEYLHEHGVICGSLGMHNLLLTADGHILLTDTYVYGMQQYGYMTELRNQYLAPEVLEGIPYGKAVDWWSYGIIMYEMLVGISPFDCEELVQIFFNIMTADVEYPAYVSPETIDILSRFLERDVKKRLQDMKLIKKHPYFTSIDWEGIFEKKISPPSIPTL